MSLPRSNLKQLFKRVAKTDRVNITTRELIDIPPNSNPFLYDATSMGTDLGNGWMVMHPGDRGELGMAECYLVNTATGQRIQLDFLPVKPVPEDVVYVGEAGLALNNQEPSLYRYVIIGNEATWHPTTIEAELTALVNTLDILYLYCDQYMVRLNAYAQVETRDLIEDMYEVIFTVAHAELARNALEKHHAFFKGNVDSK